MADFARSTHPGVQAQLDRLAKLSPVGAEVDDQSMTLMRFADGKVAYVGSCWTSPANSCRTTSMKFGEYSAEKAPTPDSRICWIEGALSITGTISRRRSKKKR